MNRKSLLNYFRKDQRYKYVRKVLATESPAKRAANAELEVIE
jgi:hypothetical protein